MHASSLNSADTGQQNSSPLMHDCKAEHAACVEASNPQVGMGMSEVVNIPFKREVCPYLTLREKFSEREMDMLSLAI